MRDQKTDSLAYLKDVLREANQRERERRKMRASGGTPDAVSHVARKAKSLVMRNALEGDVARVVGSVQQVANLGSVAKSFATDPGTAVARKLLDKVKSIVLVPLSRYNHGSSIPIRGSDPSARHHRSAIHSFSEEGKRQ